MADQPLEFVLRGELKGHGGWVTSIATTMESPDMVLSASRDKSLIIWTLGKDEDKPGVAHKRLTGHSHFVQDVAISSDGQFALSGSCDRTINLWNTLGQCKYTIQEDGHKEWVSCVRFSPNLSIPLIVSAGWDRVVKVWNLNHCKLRTNLMGHTGYVNTVTVSPDGSLCASGGKDGTAMLWDLNLGNHLSSLEAGDIIHALCFSPIRYWLCAATASTIMIWDLESKQCVASLKPQFTYADKEQTKKEGKHSKATPVQCISLAWSADGSTLFAGYTDNLIRVWEVK